MSADEEIDRKVSLVVAMLRESREEQGLSMNKLAWLAGVSVKTIDFIEKGQNSPTLRTLLKISAALELNLSTLLEQSGE